MTKRLKAAIVTLMLKIKLILPELALITGVTLVAIALGLYDPRWAILTAGIALTVISLFIGGE